MVKHAVILDADPRRPWLAKRTARSLQAAGFTVVGALESAGLVIRAGCVLRSPLALREPPSTRAGHLVAVGLPVSGEWLDFHRSHGGDYPDPAGLPAVVCEWHSSAESARVRMSGGRLGPDHRAVHWPPLDLAETRDQLRVWEIVTSLQHGGAERIALDLARTLPEWGIDCRLVALGRAHRRAYPVPDGTLDLSGIPRRDRADHLARLAIDQGVDVLHVHLTDAAETRRLAATGIPVAATVHNARAGWPRDWTELGNGDLKLMIACSIAVERELRERMPHIPVRTVWNGIDPRCYPEQPLPLRNGKLRIACVANPRPQKRLHWLPAILAELERMRPDLDFEIVIAGETAPGLGDALLTKELVSDEAARHGVSDRIRWTEGSIPVPEVLRDSHVMVSCSAFEGLSLAHLEALSTGRPVVACDVGGTSEIAGNHPGLKLLPPDAGADRFATALLEVILHPPASFHAGIWRDFSLERMASRVAGLLRGVAASGGETPQAVWFVTNNLSTGGAQSSLRRLVKALHRGKRDVRVALLQEYPEHPTAGRLDLIEAGVPVFVPPPSGVIPPEEGCSRILEEMTMAPPDAVVFWNAISAHKLLLAHGLPFARIHDVSPGEMWFTSMDKCLADPPPGLPLRTCADYGRWLAGLVVKYHKEAARMEPYGAPVTVIPNGVEIPPHPSKAPPADGRIVFGTAARISPQKRLDELLDAFRIALPAVAPAVLRIAGGVETGSEDYARQLKQTAHDLPVEWLGDLSDLRAFHESCHVFVMISDPAGCPNASLEALAAGLPVIATDVGGASEQVIDGVTGLLVPSRNPEALAAAMSHLAADTNARERLGANGREHIRRQFSMDRMLHRYINLLTPGD